MCRARVTDDRGRGLLLFRVEVLTQDPRQDGRRRGRDHDVVLGHQFYAIAYVARRDRRHAHEDEWRP